jgi:hypothetical protein
LRISTPCAGAPTPGVSGRQLRRQWQFPSPPATLQENAMVWILVLYWTLNGEVVLNHEIFTNQVACEARIEAMRSVFEMMDHPDWSASCQDGNRH